MNECWLLYFVFLKTNHILISWGSGGVSIVSFSKHISWYLVLKNICKGCLEAEEMSLLKNHNFSNLVCKDQTTGYQVTNKTFLIFLYSF